MNVKSVNTPYDDAFRTLLVKCPTIVIPLVNEVFHENYELRENVKIFHNEFYVGTKEQRERITDSHLGIRNERYHVECQSSMDGTMTVRVFEYDAQIAVETAKVGKGKTAFRFPYSALLYLRCSVDTPQSMQVVVQVSDNYTSYEMPILKVPEYTVDQILERELYFLIPFHIFAFEKKLEHINITPHELEGLLQIYTRFSKTLQQKVKEGRLTEYERQVIRDMTVKVVNSIARKWANIKKGVGAIMGGEILELEVDKILNRGKAEGLLEGMLALVRDGLLDIAEAAKRTNMTQEEFQRKIDQY